MAPLKDTKISKNLMFFGGKKKENILSYFPKLSAKFS